MYPVAFEIDGVMRSRMRKPAGGQIMQCIPGLLDNVIRDIHPSGDSIHGSFVVTEVLVSLR
jgi:hypothetical protein